MTRWIVRIILTIILVVAVNLLGLAYFISETLRDQWDARLYGYILGSFFVSFILLSFLIYHLLRNMLKPVEELTLLIKDLSRGHYWRRTSARSTGGAIQELTEYTNQLAEHLQRATENQHLNEDRLHAVIRHMGSGLLFINEKGRVVLVNQRLLEMMNWKKMTINQMYYKTDLPANISTKIEEAFEYEQEIKEQIVIHSGIDRLDIDLFVAPVKDFQGQLSGILLVFHDITDYKRLEKMREDFVANVSHELKTPLTSIKGFSETLLEGAMYSEQHLKQFLEIIHLESDRLDRLIHDLLHLSQIEQKKFQLDWGKVDLVEVIKDTLLLVQGKALDKQIQLTFEESSPVLVDGDSDRIRQIFLNLISNAIHYTAEHGRVEVEISDWEEDGYAICVKDTGIGIAEKELPRIFERFYRVDKARSRVSGGTGLGLAIVKHLVEAHHGKITVNSQEGKGSQFCVYFYRNNQQ